jgi:hypothetical protein
MRRKIIRRLLCALLALCAVETIHAQGTAFTYQGRLGDGGNPANGIYDFRFSIYDSTNNPGTFIAGPVTNSAVAVTNGLFTTQMDFSSGVFNGLDRWLQIAVRTNGAAIFTNLSPRQQLTPVPYAIFANIAGNLSGTVAATQLTGTLPASAFAGFTNLVALTNGANLFNGTFSGNGTNLSNLNASQLTGGTVADARLSTNVALLNTNQTFTGTNIFSGVVKSTGTNTFTGINTFTNLGNSFSGSFFGNGLVGWITTNGTAIQAQIDHGYLLTNSQLVTVTLPSAPNVGDIVRISGAGAGGWKIAQNAGQGVIGNFLSFSNSFWLQSDAPAAQWSTIASSADGNNLVAASLGSGDVYVSTDAGKNWNATSAISAQWRSVASSLNGAKLLAGRTSGGPLYYSTNAGSTWTASGSAPSGNWNSIAMSSDGTKAVAVNFSGKIYTSTDSGVTWTARDSNRNWFSVASSADGTTLVAVENLGQIYTSADSGVSWTPRDSNRNWDAVVSSADGVKLAAAVSSGGIYTSTDSGVSWTLQAGAPTTTWDCLASSADGARLAAGVFGGGIYTSVNSGVTWTKLTGASTQNWYALASSSDGTKLAAVVNNASSGGIYYSQASLQMATVNGVNGFLIGGQGSAVELQYIGGGKFMPVSFAGTIWAN